MPQAMPQGMPQGMPPGISQAMPQEEIITDTISETGIAANDPQNIGMAQGGIVGYAVGGDVGLSPAQQELYALQQENDARIQGDAERQGSNFGSLITEGAPEAFRSLSYDYRNQGAQEPVAELRDNARPTRGQSNDEFAVQQYRANLPAKNLAPEDTITEEEALTNANEQYSDIEASSQALIRASLNSEEQDTVTEDTVTEDAVTEGAGIVALQDADSLRAEKARVDEQMQRGLSYDNYMASLGPAMEDDILAGESQLNKEESIGLTKDFERQYGDDFPQLEIGSLYGSPRTQTLEEYKERIENERKAYGLDRTGIEAKRASLQAMKQASNERAREINAPLSALKGFLTLASSDNPNFVQAFSSSALGAVGDFMEADAQIQLADIQIEQDALAYAEGDYNRLEGDYKKYQTYKEKREEQYMALLKDYYAGIKAAAGKGDTKIKDAQTQANSYLANQKDINLTSFFAGNYVGKSIYEARIFNHFYQQSLGIIPMSTPVPAPMGGGTGKEQVQAARRKEFETTISPAQAKELNIKPGKYTRDGTGKLILIDDDLEKD